MDGASSSPRRPRAATGLRYPDEEEVTVAAVPRLFSIGPRAARGRGRLERLLNAPVAPTVGRCVACGSFVLADAAHTRARGDVMHAACGLLRPGANLRAEPARP